MVVQKNIKNRYDFFRRTSKIFVTLSILAFSQIAQAQQWERIIGEEIPGVIIKEEHPSCAFSISRQAPQNIIQWPSPVNEVIYETDNIKYNSLGQVTAYSRTITAVALQLSFTFSVSNIKYDITGRVIEYHANLIDNENPIETNIYEGTYNSLGQVSGFKEDRFYPASGKTYNIIVSDVEYDSFGNVEEGYSVTVNQDSLPILSNNISDYISDIYIWQLWNYDDLTDNNDLTYEFYLEISSYGDAAKNTNTNVESVEFLTPAGNTFEIPKLPNQWSNDIWTSYQYEYFEDEYADVIWEYKARLINLTDLQAYGDGVYTIILNHTDGRKSQTTAWFGIPATNKPIPQPTQKPALASSLTSESPITFSWEACNDPNAAGILIFLDELGTQTLRGFGFLDKTETSWGSFNLLDGFWEVNLIFTSPWSEPFSQKSYNKDGIEIDTNKFSRSRLRFTTESPPWTMYEVWGGNKWIDWEEGNYGKIADLEANGYKKLGRSDGQTKTFSGKYDYYLIATIGKFLLDSVQGSDETYYSLFEFYDEFNIYDAYNIIGPPDGQCAVVGVDYLWGDYSGYFVFNNPGNWEGLTVITSDLNLNLSICINETEETYENVAPNETITYRIHVDSHEFTQDVTDITIVAILPDEVSFVSAHSEEVSGTYDPEKHTYTWSYPSLFPESEIEIPLILKVNPDVFPGTTITNFVTINSNETPPYTTSMNILVSEIRQVEIENLSITPNELRRNGTGKYITAVIQLPEGFKQRDIDPKDVPVLYYLDQNIGEHVRIGSSVGGSHPTGTDDRPTITTYFSRSELMNEVECYGAVELRVEGKLKSGRTYFGTATIHITRFAGD